MTTIWMRCASRIALCALPVFAASAQAQTPPDAAPVAQEQAASAPDAADADSGAPRYGSLGLDTGNMNRDIAPGDDFYAYMEGNWSEHTSIPADKAAIGYNYDLSDKVDEDLRTIITAAQTHPGSDAERRIAAVYGAFLDEKGIEARGVATLQPLVARIAAIKTRAELVALMMEPGFPAAIDLSISPDNLDPTHYALWASQGELGMPAREYYLDPGEKYVAFRKAYLAYVAKIFTLAGVPAADQRAAAILALETALAKDDWAPERMRDPRAIYNPVPRAKLAATVPGVDWAAMLKAYGLPEVKTVVLAQPSALRAIAGHLARDPIEGWKDYLVFRLIDAHAAVLPAAFDEAAFDFHGRTLNGITAQRPRWRRAIGQVNAALGEDLGQLYLKQHWSPEAQAQTDEMLDDLRAAYGDLIAKASWMDGPTRAAAQSKLAAFEARVAGPRTFIDYSTFTASDDALANAIESERFDHALMLGRFAKPVDRGLWDMLPQTVNAYYSTQTNQITFPAAEMQPPFFDPNADPAINYGGIGATIGHEMGHGYDDEGRQFDAAGRLRNWWTAPSLKRYTAMAKGLADQFNAYEPLPGVHVKGDLTLGENLADLGGLQAAYVAYHRYLARHGDTGELDGMSPDQRFFLAYAQSWQSKHREDALRQQLLSDPHAPDMLRVNGIVRNLDAWYTAFNVTPDAKLYLPPEKRVKVW